ncbi:MAG: helix-turn-helix transcriptional regulator [Planctomycetes bacterium]|nr:helix-turn-helix transcriptional regulator [Planctomycetota bacterium]
MVQTAARFRFLVNPHFAEIPTSNTILYTRPGRFHIRGYKTTLTLKSVAAGCIRYRTRQSRYLVDDSKFLIFNPGQEYDTDILPEDHTDAMTFFFQPGFMEGAAQSHHRSTDGELDNGSDDHALKEHGFFERLYAKEGKVAGVLRAIRADIRHLHADPSWLEDRFYDLAHGLLDLHAQTKREVDALPVQRAATREELYRRLHHARDFLYASYAEPLTVQDAAKVACLSPFHFHRMFKMAFQQTPMSYLQQRRLDVARVLLARTEQPITTICTEVGFESLGSFSWLFRRKMGLSPRQFRAALRPDAATTPTDCRP